MKIFLYIYDQNFPISRCAFDVFLKKIFDGSEATVKCAILAFFVLEKGPNPIFYFFINSHIYQKGINFNIKLFFI